LSTVRMPLLKPSFLVDQVAQNPLVRNSIECRDLVDEAKNYYLIPERRYALRSSFKTKARCNEVSGIVYALGGLNSHQPASTSAVEM